MTAKCSFDVKLSIDDSHHTQAPDPTNPTINQTCRSDRRWNHVVRSVVAAMVAEAGTISQPAVIRGYPRNSVQYIPMIVKTATIFRSMSPRVVRERTYTACAVFASDAHRG